MTPAGFLLVVNARLGTPARRALSCPLERPHMPLSGSPTCRCSILQARAHKLRARMWRPNPIDQADAVTDPHGVTWRIDLSVDHRRADEIAERLVEHNQGSSEAMRRRFETDNLQAKPVAAYAVEEAGQLLGGCVGSTVDVWHWLTVDTMWVRPSLRGQGLGSQLLAAVEQQARERGCRWAKLNTWEFQAPDFYSRCGYTTYGREIDYPPGHINHLMRKDL
jgi:GNAT superfamily N-acetyltransferase